MTESRRQYDPRHLGNARTLRREHTDAEGLLWSRLRDRGLDGYKFRRQQPIGTYIADFACMSEKLLIELDGGGHAEQQTKDRRREEYLRGSGYRVLRFWNTEVFENLSGVLENVREALAAPPTDSAIA